MKGDGEMMHRYKHSCFFFLTGYVYLLLNSVLRYLHIKAFCEVSSRSNISHICIIHTCHPVVHTDL